MAARCTTANSRGINLNLIIQNKLVIIIKQIAGDSLNLIRLVVHSL